MSDEAIIALCVLGVGAEEYAIDVMRVRAVIRPVPVNAVPHAPPSVEGMIELRGNVIPVVDLRKRLGAPLLELGPKSRMVVVLVDGREVALVVDRVLEVMRVSREAIRPTPPLLQRGGPRFFVGVCEAATRSGPRLRMLLNLKALLESDEAVPARGEGRVQP